MTKADKEGQRKAPILRFKGFTDDWEQRELLKVCKKEDNKRIPIKEQERKEGNTPYFGANGIQGYIDGYTHDGTNILIAEDGANNVRNYPIKLITGKIWVNNHAHVLKVNTKTNNGNFLVGVIKKINFYRYLVGSSRYKLTAESLNQVKIKIAKQSEQEKIGELLKNIEELLTLYERKLKLLSQVKKYFLDNLFAEKEYPNLRFKGFTDAWEQRQLGEVSQLNGRIGFRGYTAKDIISKESGGILTFSPTNIINNLLEVKGSNTYITREKYEESPEIQVNNSDILFVKTGSTLGKSALVSGLMEPATINPQIVIIRSQRKWIQFLSVLLMTSCIQKQITAAKIGGAVPTLTESEIKKFKFYIPNDLNETGKIGQFFSKIDSLIALYENKQQHFTEIKKTLLNTMFI